MTEVPLSSLRPGQWFSWPGLPGHRVVVLTVDPWSAVVDSLEDEVMMLDAPPLRGWVKSKVRSREGVIPLEEDPLDAQTITERLADQRPVVDSRVYRGRG